MGDPRRGLFIDDSGSDLFLESGDVFSLPYVCHTSQYNLTLVFDLEIQLFPHVHMFRDEVDNHYSPRI